MKWKIKTLCGIVGHIVDGGLSKEFDLQKITYSMLDELTSRGPDDQGIWIEKNERVCMGHRRLSIQDLSKAGYQPMESKNKNVYDHHNFLWLSLIDRKVDGKSIQKIIYLWMFNLYSCLFC